MIIRDKKNPIVSNFQRIKELKLFQWKSSQNKIFNSKN